jgi:hypothetical protein
MAQLSLSLHAAETKILLHHINISENEVYGSHIPDGGSIVARQNITGDATVSKA